MVMRKIAATFWEISKKKMDQLKVDYLNLNKTLGKFKVCCMLF